MHHKHRRTHVMYVWFGLSWSAAASPAQDGSKAAVHAQVKQHTLPHVPLHISQASSMFLDVTSLDSVIFVTKGTAGSR